MSASSPFGRAAEQAQSSDMLLRLLRVARGAGVRISVAEAIDAFESANAVGYADRQALKDALTLTIAKSIEDKQLFEQCFETYFKRENTALSGNLAEKLSPPSRPDGEGAEGEAQGMGGEGQGARRACSTESPPR
ncbi:MAG: hypothetical protein ACOVRP_13330, partial [Gemmatimonas sp.]